MLVSTNVPLEFSSADYAGLDIPARSRVQRNEEDDSLPLDIVPDISSGPPSSSRSPVRPLLTRCPHR